MPNVIRRAVRISLVLLLAAVPIAVFYALLAHFSLAMPIEDDYDAILGFALRWHHAGVHGHAAYLLLTDQHNEYKPFLQDIFLVTQLAVCKRVLLLPWIWTGNVLLLAALVPLWLSCLPGKAWLDRLAWFLPVVWIVVSLNYAETLNFALSGLQELTVVVFGLTTIYLATRKRPTAKLAATAMVLLAYLSYANACLLAPMGLAFFRRSKKKFLLPWCLAVLAVGVLYAYGYHRVPHASASPGQFILFALAMMGSAFTYFRLPGMLPVCFGAVLCALLVYATYRGYHRLNSVAFWGAVFMFGSCLMAAYGRASGGFLLALASRYRLYSDVLLACIYLLYLAAAYEQGQLERRKWLYPAALCASIMFGLFSDAVGFRVLQSRHRQLVYGMRHYLATGGRESPVATPEVPVTTPERAQFLARARDVLSTARREGLYEVPLNF